MRRIDKANFTHYAWFRGVPCYWNNNTNELSGRNLLFDLALEWMAMPFDGLIQWLCILVSPDYDPGFAIRLTGCIEKRLQP